MVRTFSQQNRQHFLNEMSSGELDLLIIGGGITGCGIALDAANRGLKVGLLEMQDFAAGTSSRSTKLIHGGLRYLKQLEIKLVKEVGRERAILHENAPHIVKPEPMLLPLIKNGSFGKISTSFGLYVYDRLAQVKKQERRKMLSKEEALKKEPLLRDEGLKGAGLYYEYQTDDARLTLEVVKTAFSLGANAVNYCGVEELIYNESGKVNGGVAFDSISGKTHHIYAKKIVNATGPWVDSIRKQDRSLTGKHLHVTKGVHIVVDQKRFPLRQAMYFDVEDGRMIFAIPRADKTYIGTTDTTYRGDLADPTVSIEDKNYLIKATNNMFPSINISVDDIESSWAGLRPLIHEEGKSPSDLSRKDEIFLSNSGLITIAGGKLTGFRKMAEKTVNLVVKQLAEEYRGSYPRCETQHITLSGGDVGGANRWENFVKEKLELASKIGFEKKKAWTLIHRYGTNVDKVFERFVELNKYRFNTECELKAELYYCVEEEMVVKAEDYLIRRTGDYYFNWRKSMNRSDLVNRLLYMIQK
ncbi:glycerol-3-phosphate dehydrogenase/oxidase [Evansella cellulosilytica]|nr:glycerol-3-phosphate dehydrogenase/oxidase [Evansella cellulosilytica]